VAMTLRPERDLAALIDELGLTQKQVARSADISEGMLSQVCKHRKAMRAETAARIVAALGAQSVTLDFLFETHAVLPARSVVNRPAATASIQRPA
jgi:predicted transcriptional regulator